MSEDLSNEDRGKAFRESFVVPENEMSKPIGEIPGIEEITDQLPEKTLKELTLTPQEALKLKKSIETKSILGSQAMLPMMCKGPTCPIAKTCMLQQIGKAPIGQECPLELALMNKLKDELVQSLDVDWNDRIERQAVMDLVETEILQARANGILSEEGFIMENVVGISEHTGEAIMRKEKHIALEVKDMIYKRKERLLKSLVATKEMRKKLGMGGKDPSKNESDLLKRLRKVKARDDEESKVVIQDAEVIDTEKSKRDKETPKEKPKS